QFTPQMIQALTYVDGAIGSMVSQLRAQNLIGSTEIIISAKYGQSLIDPSLLAKIGDQVTPILTGVNIAIGQNTTDDILLVWLGDQSQTATAVAALTANQNGANTVRISTILLGTFFINQFGNPQANARTPDIIVEPIPGTIYSIRVAKV